MQPSKTAGEIHLQTVTSVSKSESKDASRYSFLVTFDSDSTRSKLIGSHLPSSPLQLSTVTAVSIIIIIMNTCIITAAGWQQHKFVTTRSPEVTLKP